MLKIGFLIDNKLSDGGSHGTRSNFLLKIKIYDLTTQYGVVSRSSADRDVAWHRSKYVNSQGAEVHRNVLQNQNAEQLHAEGKFLVESDSEFPLTA